MNREQEQLKHFGFFGIFRESFKLIFSCPKIFIQITLSLLLPLWFVSLANSQISQFIGISTLIPKYSDIGITVFTVANIIIASIISLLVTAPIVYTIVCIYTSQVTSFKKIMSVVPKVWTPFSCTFFVGLFCFISLFIPIVLVLVLWIFLFAFFRVAGIVVGVVLSVLYLIPVVYISIVCELANVMSVVEQVKGIQALKKSRILIQGKIVDSFLVFIVLNICLGGIQVLFQIFVVQARMYPSVGIRVAFAILCLLLMTMVVLLSLVIQTVTYFVCKSYHHEDIEASSLSHLHGHHVPSPHDPNRDVQLERLPV